MKSYGKAFGMLLMAAGLVLTGCGTDTAMQPEAKASALEAREKFPEFKTTDLSGAVVTSDIFAQKKITVVNIWGTFCPPCIGEMPELGEWATDMPRDAQLIGIVCDAENEQDGKTIREAEKILQGANAKFVNLLPNRDLMNFLETVDAVPTTVFVDSEGRMIGKPVIGANVAAYRKVVKDYLNE